MKKYSIICLLLSGSVLSGCSSAPPPITEEKIKEQEKAMNDDLQNMMKMVPKDPSKAQ